MNPGENAISALNKSPLLMPSDSAYEAPSENPPSAMRAGSMLHLRNASSSALSMNRTSGPYPPSERSHVPSRESGAITIIAGLSKSPASVARDQSIEL